MSRWEHAEGTLSFAIPGRVQIRHVDASEELDQGSGSSFRAWTTSNTDPHGTADEDDDTAYDDEDDDMAYAEAVEDDELSEDGVDAIIEILINPDGAGFDVYRRGSDGAIADYDHKVWWWEDTDCDGSDCSCGRLSLLAALEYLDHENRTTAVRVHAEEMRSLFEHFWAGQGLTSGASDQIGDACPECIIRGAEHVWDIYGSACELAEELGEALAAYAYDLFVGEPRFREHGC